jgi:hypothetical protein
MTLLNPEHLLDQADELAAPPASGAPRQANLRRAVSTAYYALFHAILTDVADQLVGKGQRDTPQYALVYRSVSHRHLNELCTHIAKDRLPEKYKPYEPQGGFDADLTAFARTITELKETAGERRLRSSIPRNGSDVSLALQAGRSALVHWRNVPAARRRLFMLMLTFL